MNRRKLLTIYNGSPVYLKQKVRFTILERHRSGKRLVPLEIEYIGAVSGLTKDGTGVVLEGVTISGQYSRRFEELPEFQRMIVAPHIHTAAGAFA